MNLSISNIAWDKTHDELMYKYMKEVNYTGLEIAPTRIIEQAPYDYHEEIAFFEKQLKLDYNIEISSMQSIWFGRSEQLFASDEEFKLLLEYTKKAVRFASSANCKNIVFGCPKNRIVADVNDYNKALLFFEVIGEYALKYQTIVALEANPTIYGTNFINATNEAFEFVNRLETKGVKVNFDLGTLIYNQEDLAIIDNNIELINHVHISEPNLLKIEKRELHDALSTVLKNNNYDRFVSIEMKKQDEINLIKETMHYVMEVFN